MDLRSDGPIEERTGSRSGYAHRYATRTGGTAATTGYGSRRYGSARASVCATRKATGSWSLPASRASVSRPALQFYGEAAGSRTTIYIGICTCPYYSKGHPDLTLP